MMRNLIVVGIFAVAGCDNSDLGLDVFHTADREKLSPINVEIDGKTYEVRRNRDTFPNSVRDRWAIVKDGQVISCLKPTVESCEEALKGETRGGGGGGMY